MNTHSRKIAGFMSAESIYSLAFYIVMVAAIAGVGAGVLSKKDSAKSAAAISLIRANFVAESATLGYSPVALAATIQRLSGHLLELDTVANTVSLPGGGLVSMGLRSTTFPMTGFTINVVGVTKPDVCNAIGGVGYGTWSAFAARTSALPSSAAIINTSAAPFTTKAVTKGLCDLAAAGVTAVNMIFASY